MSNIYLICQTCGHKECVDSEMSANGARDCSACGYTINYPAARILGLALLAGEEVLPTVGSIDTSVVFARRMEMLVLEMSKMLQLLNPKLVEQSAKEQMRLFAEEVKNATPPVV